LRAKPLLYRGEEAMSKPVFSDLFTLSGRRNRKSYILFCLCVFVIYVVLSIVIGMAGASGDGAAVLATSGIGIILWLVIAIAAWPVGAQRCRDFGWTGWAILITIIPFVGGLFAIALWFIPGTQGANRYGPDPLGGAEPAPAVA
jgi:uncharacterized membrane protein YhaH (DUF805 family)